MKNFSQNNRLGGGKNSGGRSSVRRDFGNRSSGGRDFGGRDAGRTTMHKAVCDECGQGCEVPFRPTGDKPIYCSECFKSKRGGDGDARNTGGRNRENPRFGDRADRQMFSAVCSECKNKCEVPFRPTGDKPVYCNSCFEKNKRGGSERGGVASKSNDGQLKNQLDALNAKLDKVLQMLEGNIPNKLEFKAPAKEAKKEIIKIVEDIKELKPGKPEKTVKVAKKAAAKKTVTKKKK